MQIKDKNMTNDDQPPRKLKTLFDQGVPSHTSEQGQAFWAKRKREADAETAAMHKWTDEEVIQYLDAFKAQRPERYAEYIRQEIDIGRIDQIDPDLSLEMMRFAGSLFPNATVREVTQLFVRARRHVRSTLKLV